MKKIQSAVLGFTALLTTLSSCESFTDINKSVATVYEVDPIGLLYQVQAKSQSAGSTWTDSYACKLRWLQYCSNIWGYSTTNFTYFATSIGSDLYNEYINMGSYARHIEYYVNEFVPEGPAAYTNLIETARIMLISKGIQASDMHGSLVYTEGWGTRMGKPELIEPHYQTQEELYTLWDKELKEAASKMKTSTNQKSLAGYDMAYNGDAAQWVKAANALRLRIAIRLMKRDPAKAKAIAQEVLSGDIFASNKDGLILRFDKLFTSEGDWHSVIDMDRASAPFMKYLTKFEDPRKRLYFQINNLTPENVAKYNQKQTDPANFIPADFTRWEGGTVSYDERATDKRYQSRDLNGTDMRAMNKPQTRLWKGMQDNGSGGSWFPVLTYADFCFMAAEFSLEGVSSGKTAEEWYTTAVRSSIEQWSEIGDYCKINDYVAVTPTEIDAFLAQDGIKWNPATGKEQIYCQEWVEHFKNNNESWVLWKRTGYPNTQSKVVTFDKVMITKVEQTIPRRTRFSYPAEGSPNYTNKVKSLEEMAKDPEFGQIVDEFGRLWFDKK